MKFLVTGGAGFIGSALIREIVSAFEHDVLNLDCLTYAGNLHNLESISSSPKYRFVKGDIADANIVESALYTFQPDIVINLAAESHVDRSISCPKEFVQTNIVGTFNLLEKCRQYYQTLPTTKKSSFVFHHVSTDEVFGDLSPEEPGFSETTPYAPSSPYSASKASSDHLVRAWHRTFGLPTIITNCSNNYGPFHFPEKFIPRMILNAICGTSLPIFGEGQQIRDWLYVEDHARALIKVATEGHVGETYNIGGHNELRNIEVVHSVCKILDGLIPANSKRIEYVSRIGLQIKNRNTFDNYSDLIQFVPDRPGHDVRYAIDAAKIDQELGWRPLETFETGLQKTVEWYLDNADWWLPLLQSEESVVQYRGFKK